MGMPTACIISALSFPFLARDWARVTMGSRVCDYALDKNTKG